MTWDKGFFQVPLNHFHVPSISTLPFIWKVLPLKLPSARVTNPPRKQQTHNHISTWYSQHLKHNHILMILSHTGDDFLFIYDTGEGLYCLLPLLPSSLPDPRFRIYILSHWWPFTDVLPWNNFSLCDIQIKY